MHYGEEESCTSHYFVELQGNKKKMLKFWKAGNTEFTNKFTVFENHRKSLIQQFNMASEASYVYILSEQKLIKNAKNCPFWQVFENPKLAVKQCYQTGDY